jgi:hypothetical protein
MRLTISLTAAVALCAWPSLANAQAANTPAVPTKASAPAKAAAFQLNETSWKYTNLDGIKAEMSIDAKGNYIEQGIDGKHLDHGTSVMKGDKACFTSAMTKEGEMCWTTKPVEVGQAMDTVNEKGKKLTVNRVAYIPLSMPK